jgi:hypothetical protein
VSQVAIGCRQRNPLPWPHAQWLFRGHKPGSGTCCRVQWTEPGTLVRADETEVAVHPTDDTGAHAVLVSTAVRLGDNYPQ